MAVFRVNKTKDYTVMSNVHLRDKRLSLKAKGLQSLMLSLPDDWDFSIAGFAAICKENETAIKSAMKELQTFGYMRRTKQYPKEGSQRITYVYDVFESPQGSCSQEVDSQGIDSQGVGFLQVENQGQLNTDYQRTDESKDELSITEKTTTSSKIEKIDYQAWKDAYTENVTKLGGIRAMSDSRKAAVRSMLKNGITIDDFKEACKIANESDFLTGGGSRGWKASAEWMFNVNNVIKVLEGNYGGSKQHYKLFEETDDGYDEIAKMWGMA